MNSLHDICELCLEVIVGAGCDSGVGSLVTGHNTWEERWQQVTKQSLKARLAGREDVILARGEYDLCLRARWVAM